MEPIRRAALIEAAIAEIGQAGSLDVTVSQIARRAGVSSALAHHYFGGKEQLFLSTMRHILRIYGDIVRDALKGATTPRARVEAIILANFEACNFQPEVICAWLNFYVQALTSDQAARLLRVYQHRLRSNLVHEMRPLVGSRAHSAAEGIAAMIDGVYIRHALHEAPPDSDAACAQILAYVDMLIGDAA